MSPGSAPISSFPGRILIGPSLARCPTLDQSVDQGRSLPGNMAAPPAALRVEGKGRAQKDSCLWKCAGPDQGLEESATPYPLSVGSLRLLADCLLALPSSWKTYLPGWPRCLDEETVKNLNLNIKYSAAKNTTFYLRGGSA